MCEQYAQSRYIKWNGRSRSCNFLLSTTPSSSSIRTAYSTCYSPCVASPARRPTGEAWGSAD